MQQKQLWMSRGSSELCLWRYTWSWRMKNKNQNIRAKRFRFTLTSLLEAWLSLVKPPDSYQPENVPLLPCQYQVFMGTFSPWFPLLGSFSHSLTLQLWKIVQAEERVQCEGWSTHTDRFHTPFVCPCPWLLWT